MRSATWPSTTWVRRAALACTLAGCQLQINAEPPSPAFEEVRAKLPPFAQVALPPAILTPDAANPGVECPDRPGNPAEPPPPKLCLISYTSSMPMGALVDRVGAALAGRYPVVSLPLPGVRDGIGLVSVKPARGALHVRVFEVRGSLDVTIWLTEDFQAADVAAGGPPPDVPGFAVPDDAQFLQAAVEAPPSTVSYIVASEPVDLLRALEDRARAEGRDVQRNGGTLTIDGRVHDWVITVTRRAGGGSVADVGPPA